MKSKLLSFLFICTSALTHIAGAAEMFHPEKLAALDEAVEQAVRDGQILGAALWVEREGEAHHKAFGLRSIVPQREGMTEDTIFDVASITKVMATASAAMLCIERGGLETLDNHYEPFAPFARPVCD